MALAVKLFLVAAIVIVCMIGYESHRLFKALADEPGGIIRDLFLIIRLIIVLPLSLIPLILSQGFEIHENGAIPLLVRPRL